MVRKGASWYRDYLNPQVGNSLSPDLAVKFFKAESPDTHAPPPHRSWQSAGAQTVLNYLSDLHSMQPLLTAPSAEPIYSQISHRDIRKTQDAK